MTLPIRALATSSHEIEGVAIPIRSLSRNEVVSLAKFDGDASGAETFLVSRSTGVTEEEATDWLGKVDAKTAGLLLDAIAVLSGLRSAKNA
jgi:hypothetical protein